MGIKVKKGVVWKAYKEIIAGHEYREFSRMMQRNGLPYKLTQHDENYSIVDTWLPRTGDKVTIGKFLFTEEL